MELHLTATECHLPYGITQCYLHPTQVNTPRFNPSQTGRYSIYLPRKVGRLYWPRWWVTYRDGLYSPVDSHPSKY